MNIRKTFIAAGIASGIALAANATVFYQQSFDYTPAQNGLNFTNANFPGEGWSSVTNVITYQHDEGLSYPGLPATGGALQYDHDGDSGGRKASQTFENNLSFADYSAGDTFYFSALMRVDRALNSGATISVDFEGNNVVNRPKFILTPDEMRVEAWTNGAITTISGPSYSVGDTLAFYMELEKGTTDTNNILSIWFNPSTMSNPGTPDFVSTSDTRFGRNAGILTGIAYSGDNVGDTQWTLDEVRVATTAIPEPGTLLLVGMALGSLLLFRRRR